MLRADGADLVLVEAEPEDRAHPPAARLDDASAPTACSRRISSATTISEALAATRVPGEFELVLDDPRRDEQPG